jgi:hypothetical protein
MPQNNLEKDLFPGRELAPDDVSFNYLASRVSRRGFLKNTGKLFLGAAVSVGAAIYASSALSSVYARASESSEPSENAQPSQNSQISEIDIGTLQVPVTLDGRIEEAEWYSDSIDYKYNFVNKVFIKGVTSIANPVGILRAKYDDIKTYVANCFTNDTVENNHRSYNIQFNIPKVAGTDYAGMYILNIDFPNPRNPVETSGKIPDLIPFMKVFRRTQHYDWKYYFGPCPLNSAPHTHLELEFLNSVLTSNSNRRQVETQCGYAYSDGSILTIDSRVSPGWLPIVYEGVPLPEGGNAAMAAGAVGATALAAWLVNNKKNPTESSSSQSQTKE